MSGALVHVWLAAAVLAPLALAILLALPMRERLLILTPFTALPALTAAWWLPDGVTAAYPWVLLGLEFAIDSTGRAFLLLTALLWLAAGVYALGYLRDAERRAEFHVWLLLAMCGNLGLVLAVDAIGFYAFFTIMSLASYGLVVFDRRDEAWRAGRVYLILAVLGEVLVLAGLALHVDRIEALSFERLAADPPAGLALWAIIAGFGIKAGLLPLHVWLPLAHPAAPTPASAVLSGAMIKAGLLGWLRVLPAGDGSMPDTGIVLIALGLAAAFLGVIAGLMQARPKTILAYSSISQMGFMTAGVGLALALPAAGPALLAAIVLYALHHGIAKAALFLAVGVFERARGPWLYALLALPALALAGLPFTSGAAAKTALKTPLAAADPAWAAAVEWLLALAAAGTTLLMAHFVMRLRAGARHEAPLPRTMLVPWVVLCLAAVVLPWWWSADLAFAALAIDKLWPLLWPLLLGATLFAVLARSGLRLPGLPEGDLWLPIERWSVAGWRRIAARAPAQRTTVSDILGKIAFSGMLAWRRGRVQARRAEAWLMRWENLGVLFVTLIVTFYLVLWLAPAQVAHGSPQRITELACPCGGLQPAAYRLPVVAVTAAEPREERALLGDDLETGQVDDE